MKQFIYLNTDMINSIIAQKNNGLIQKFTKDFSKSDSKGNSNALKVDVGADANFGLKKLAEMEASIDLGGEHKWEHDHQKTMRSIYEKTLHDATFDIAYEIIQPKIVEFNNNEVDQGEYIKITRVFDFVDLEYLKKLFSEKGIVELFISQDEDEFKKIINDNTNRDQRRNNKADIKEALNSQIDKKRKEYNKIKDSLDVLFETLPYSRLLFAGDGYIIPVEEQYFRVNPKGLGFIYGSDIHVVGLITNTIGKDTKPNESNNIFSNIQFGINEIIRAILPTEDDNLYVLTPLAIYYE